MSALPLILTLLAADPEPPLRSMPMPAPAQFVVGDAGLNHLDVNNLNVANNITVGGTASIAGDTEISGTLVVPEVDTGILDAGVAIVVDTLNVGGQLTVGDNGITSSGVIIGASDGRFDRLKSDKALSLYPNTGGTFIGVTPSTFIFNDDGSGFKGTVPWGTWEHTVGTEDAGSFLFSGGPIRSTNPVWAPTINGDVDAGIVWVHPTNGAWACNSNNNAFQAARVVDGGTFWYYCDGNAGFWNNVSKGLDARAPSARTSGSMSAGQSMGSFRPSLPGIIERAEVQPMAGGAGSGFCMMSVEKYFADGGSSNICNLYSSCTAANAKIPTNVACTGTFDPWTEQVIAVGIIYDGGCATVPDVRSNLVYKRGASTLPNGD